MKHYKKEKTNLAKKGKKYESDQAEYSALGPLSGWWGFEVAVEVVVVCL